MPLVARDEPAENVVQLTLDRPEKRNALSWALVEELSNHLRKLHDEPARVVVLTGAPPVFCAGADLEEQFHRDRTDLTRPDIGRSDLWSLLETLPQVTVAAVAGSAVTGGFLLAYICDLVVAERDAVLRDTHAAFGLIPTGGEVQRLLARVGPGHARDILLTSRPIDVDTAYEWGLVNRRCASGEAVRTAIELAAEVAANDPSALRSIKRMLNGGLRTTMAAGLMMDELENRVGGANLRRSEDSLQRIDRFFGSRP